MLVCAASLGCGGGQGVPPRPGERAYRGATPPLALSLAYPSDWRLTEEAGRREPYAQLRLLGPRNAEDTYTAYIAVRGVAPEAERGAGESLDERVRRYADELLDGATIESVQPASLQQAEARELVTLFTVPPLFRSGLKPLPIPVKTRAVFVHRGPYRYELIYSADAREYAAHAPAFDRVLASLRFR
jgi:hypothetical protein